jgi:pSer/pThr/pTyr-binding forkhead associated (FHA) protein
LKNTVLSDLNQSDWDHTRIETPLHTGIEPLPAETPTPSVVPAALTPPSLARTQLYAPGQTDGPGVRKLVGWLVSYTLNPAGADFRIYEGRNSVGTDPGCDVVVPGDPAVSARHLTLLYRSDGFRFKDELSTNGTFVNDQMRDEGVLQDGDMIRVGNTVFKFRSAL